MTIPTVARAAVAWLVGACVPPPAVVRATWPAAIAAGAWWQPVAFVLWRRRKRKRKGRGRMKREYDACRGERRIGRQKYGDDETIDPNI